MNKEEKNMMKLGQIQNRNGGRYTKTLKGMLDMIDQIMRIEGHNEEVFKEI